MPYYKFLTKKQTGFYSDFSYDGYLPKGKRPGKWLPYIEDIKMCQRGYHACKREDVLEWLNDEMYEVEFKGDVIEGDDKVVGHQMRFVRKIDGWNDRTARLFAVWCAREALKLIDEPDPRSIEACNVAERYANGEATDEELAAAWAAAWDAAWAAAWGAAIHAARAAAIHAALDAAIHAARAAAWDAARDAQIEQLWKMVGK